MKSCLEILTKGFLAIVGLLIILMIIGSFLGKDAGDKVVIKSSPFIGHRVRVWNNLSGNDTMTAQIVADTTSCVFMDGNVYKSYDSPTIFYYRVNCDGIVGYLDKDMVK